MKCSALRTINKQIEKVWDEMTDVPFDENEKSDDGCYLVLGEDYSVWKKGTTRDDIWRWFDKHHSKGVYYLLYERKIKYC
jgi:hypothetical protein